MSIQSEITRLSGNVSDALDAIEAKGVTIPTGANSDDLANLIGQISRSTDFIITVSYNSTTQMWEPDCTFAEIQAAYNAGKTISVMADSLDAVSDGIYDSDESSLIYLVYQYSDSSVETITQYYYVYSSSGLWANDPDSYIIPAGTKNITQNGAGIDVAAYASVDVAVPLPPDGNLLAYGYTDPTLPLVGVAQVGQAEI